MKVEYSSLRSAVASYIEDSALDDVNINEELLFKWATDCARWLVNSPELLKHKIAILRVDNYKTKLPDDFKMVQVAASNPDMPKPGCKCGKPKGKCKCAGPAGYNPSARTRHETVSQWIQRSFDPECDLDINLVCDSCHKKNCSCKQPTVEVDIDSIWMAANPQAFYKGYRYAGKFGYGEGGLSKQHRPRFNTMRAAHSYLFNAEHYVTDCPSIGCRTHNHQFELDLPYMEVDFASGEVFLSYLALRKDKEGDYMIPDHPDAFEAINNHLDYKWYAREAAKSMRSRKEKSFAVQYKQLSQAAKMEREEHIGLFKAEVDIPDMKDFKNFLDNQWLKRIPNHSYSENFNEMVPDQAVLYGMLMDGSFFNCTY